MNVIFVFTEKLNSYWNLFVIFNNENNLEPGIHLTVFYSSWVFRGRMTSCCKQSFSSWTHWLNTRLKRRKEYLMIKITFLLTVRYQDTYHTRVYNCFTRIGKFLLSSVLNNGYYFKIQNSFLFLNNILNTDSDTEF